MVDTMMPPRIPPIPRAVQLKHSVDIQLDRAFHEQQWTIAANLARQRHKSTKDEYYKAVEIAAKSRGDNATDRTIGKEFVQAMINDNVTVKDVDALDLYEFSTNGLSMDYAKTIGVLRARLVKALPKDQSAGLSCLEACMWNSDWENAQEIAVSLNKNFPADRKLLFQNILITFLVATADSTNENKKKLFGNLAKAQVDRAFNLRPLTGKEQTPPDQLRIGENEIKLWIKIRERFGLPQENLKLLTLPNWGPLFFLENGFMDAFLHSIQLLAFNNHWEELIRVVNVIFDRVIATGGESQDQRGSGPIASQQPENAVNSAASTASEHAITKQYMNASREWSVWKSAVNATENLPNGQEALDDFQRKIRAVISILTGENRMNPVFQQNYDRILLEITFTRAAMASGSSHGTLGDNNKVHHLLEFAKKHIKGSNCFTVLKGYLELLTIEEISNFVDAWETEYNEDNLDLDAFDKLLLVALRLRVRFFQATSLRAGEECRFCHTMANDGPDCETCLESITERAIDAFSIGVQDQGVSQKAASETEDPLSNLAVLGSICLVRLAGAGRKSWQRMKESPLYYTDMSLFLRAVAWLDFYLRKTPKNDSLRLLLVKLYLMMGCVTRALHIWDLFDVKNTLLECLGILCLDRLGSMSPGHFATGPGHRNFAEPFIHHFETAIQKRYPDAVVKTLQNSSYAELPDIIELAQNQSRNCVSVLAVVEGRRAARLRTGRNETAIEDELLIGSLSPDYELRDSTDYNPLPHWTGRLSTPIQELVAYGPLPTNRRCHLSILAERFLDLINHVHPKDFKPTKPTQILQADWQAAALSSKTLHRDLDALVQRDEDDLTSAETWYFLTVTELARLVNLVLETVVLPTSSPTKAARDDILAAIRRIATIIDHQAQDFMAVPWGLLGVMPRLYGVSSLHVMGMLRETTFAVGNAVRYVATTLDRAKDHNGRHNKQVAWVVPETRRLMTSAGSIADAWMKVHVKDLETGTRMGGWARQLDRWTFTAATDDDDNNDGGVAHDAGEEFRKSVGRKLAAFIPSDAREAWAADIEESWRDVVKGWAGGSVRLE